MEGATGDGEHAQPAVRGMTERDRDAALELALFMRWWQHAAVLVRHGVSAAQRDAALLQAAEHDQWDVAMDVLAHGASLQARDAIFPRAAQQRRWDCAGMLSYLGMSPETLDCVFSDVVDGDVWLCSNLSAAGVSSTFQGRVLRRAIELGRVSFVVELLRQPLMTHFTAFVLDTTISLENWTLVFEVVKMHEELQLSAEKMDAACTAAGRGLQCLALSVDTRGTQQFQEIVDVVLRPGPDVLYRFLGIFPRGKMPSSVKQILIKSVIKLDRLDALKELLSHHDASEQETEEAFDSAVNCRNEKALQVLVSHANRNSQLLKQLCATKYDGYPPENYAWICQALKDRHLVLSFDIALAANSRDFVEHVVLSDETSRKVRRMFLQKVCANSQDLFREIAEKLVVRHPRYRRTLYLMSVRQNYPLIALTLYGKGVSLRDVKRALGVSSNERSCLYYHPSENLVWDYIKKPNSEDGSKLFKDLVRTNVDYFVSRGNNEAEFLTWFKRYCEWQDADSSFVVSVFRRVYKAAVRWDRKDCFVKSITHVMEFSDKKRRRVAETLFERGTTAYNDHISGEDMSEVVAAIDFALKKLHFRFISRIGLLAEGSAKLIPCVLKRAFRKKAWPVFDTLFEMQSKTGDSYFASRYGYGQVFIHCLSRTVVKVSDTVTVGASNTVPVIATDTLTVGASSSGTVEPSDTRTVGAVRMLNKWLQNMCSSWKKWLKWDNPGCVLTLTLGSDWRLSKRSGAVLRLAEFSSRHACHGLALFLAAVLGAEGRELMERVVASHLDSVDRHLVMELACYAVKSLKNPAAAAVLLKNLPLSALPADHICMEDTKHLCKILTDSSQDFIVELKRENAHCWVLVCQLVVKDFTEAEKTLTSCNSQEYDDVVVEPAAVCSRANVLCMHASTASGHNFLRSLLSDELKTCSEGNVGAVRCLINLVGTSAGVRRSGSYLSDVCKRLYHKPEEAVELARCLVSLGASAQHRRVGGRNERECPLKRASIRLKLQLVKLFHRSGACSNQRLFQLAETSHGFWPAGHRNRRMDGVDKALIQSYLTSAARSPLSLQDLCRNAVSSSLGGRPGYLQRVQAVPVPALVKEFILFSDLSSRKSLLVT